MGATAERMTVEEYYAADIQADWAQLIDGVVVVNQPRPLHALLQHRLALALGNWTDAAAGRGLTLLTTDVVVDEYDVYGPDILWIAERNRPNDLRARLVRVPDLCVEVRSPSTWEYDVGAKARAYERAGLPELWLVDDRAPRVLVYRRSRPASATFDVQLELTAGDTLSSPQLPGFALPLERLFAD